MSALLRRGLIAALAPRGVPNADIIVTDKIGDQLCAVQVKTRLRGAGDNGWHMGAKHEEITSPNIYYVFVGFETEPPGCWIVPSAIVAEALKLSHGNWLAMPGKGGRAHNDSKMRRFRFNYDNVGLQDKYPKGWLDQYKDAWHLLEAAGET
jgi:hypothetical protein